MLSDLEIFVKDEQCIILYRGGKMPVHECIMQLRIANKILEQATKGCPLTLTRTKPTILAWNVLSEKAFLKLYEDIHLNRRCSPVSGSISSTAFVAVDQKICIVDVSSMPQILKHVSQRCVNYIWGNCQSTDLGLMCCKQGRWENFLLILVD